MNPLETDGSVTEKDNIDALEKSIRQRRRATRRRWQPQKIADVLANLMARRGYGRVQSASTFAEAWTAAVGGQLAAASRPGNIRRGTLEVTVRNSAVMQELSFRKERLLSELTRLLPDQRIAALRFRVGDLS